MDELIREAMRERCTQLALHLYAGQEASVLVAELEELARENWAFREDDDA